MSIAITQDIRNEGNLPSGVVDALLQPHLVSAEIEFKKAVGFTRYDELNGYSGSADTTEIFLYTSAKKAEALLALSYAVHSLNIETNGSGIVRSTGWDENRNELLSRVEVENLSNHYRTLALGLINDLMPVNNSAEEEITNVGNNNFRLGAI